MNSRSSSRSRGERNGRDSDRNGRERNGDRDRRKATQIGAR